MTASVSLLPPQTGASLAPPNPVNGLSDDERNLVTGLASKLSFQTPTMELRWLYYDGLQRMQNLGILVPPQLAGVRTVVDWPRICIDPLVDRCVVDGFRLAGGTDVDDELAEIWSANDLDAEAPLSFLDSLVTGRGYLIVGSPDTPGDAPLVTVESPLNLAMTWDPRTRAVRAAYQSFQAEGVYRAVLYVPGVTISMSRDGQNAAWTVDDRDEHGFDDVPVVRLPNRARSSDREGQSQITPAVMNTTDSACRSLLGMEIAREFYSIPHRWGVGLSESDFQDAEGNPKSGLDMAMTKFLAVERDEDGNMPQLGQFTAFDPSVFTKIIDEHAQLMSSYTGFPPSYFGQGTTANPASADAIRVAENGLDRGAERKQGQFTPPLRRVAQLMWRFANGGAELPTELRNLEVDWIDARTPTPTGTSDAVTKQVTVGAIPATSDVTLAELGYTAVQRRRLAADRQLDAGAQVLAELATSLQAKEARTDLSVAHDINPASTKPQPGDSAPGTAG